MTTPEHKSTMMLWSRVGWRSVGRQLTTDTERRLTRRRAIGAIAAVGVAVYGFDLLNPGRASLIGGMLRVFGGVLLVLLVALAVYCLIGRAPWPFVFRNPLQPAKRGAEGLEKYTG